MKNFALLTVALVAVLLAAGQLARAAERAHLPILASQDWWPAWSLDGTQIAFTRISGRTMTLYVVDVASHKTFRVAANQGQLEPSWSSDGRLAYTAGGKIWTADADGSNKARAGTGFAPAWRPRSSDIASVTTNLLVNGVVWANNVIGSPAWAPDGTQLAFERDDGIYVTAGPNAEKKVSGTLSEPRSAAWSPDGKQIAFVAGNHIWVVPADGSHAARVQTPTPLGSLSALGWSRAGDALAFTADGSAWISHLDSAAATKLAPAAGQGATFSPVSNTIAFSGAHPGCAGHSAIHIGWKAITGSCDIIGTRGNDVIDGTSAGGDVILAGAGDDIIHANNGRRDVVECGPGRDVVDADRSDILRHCEVVR